MTDQFRFTFGISTRDMRKLRDLGGDPGTHIAQAMRAYLIRHKRANPGLPLPFESGPGRTVAGSVSEVTWLVPDDIRSAFSWGSGAHSHVRSAVEQYLAEYWRPAMNRAPLPSGPPQPDRKVTVDLPSELLDKLKRMRGPLSAHFERAVREYKRRYARQETTRPDDRKHGDILTGAEIRTGVKEIRWNVPATVGTLPSERLIRAALREYVEGKRMF